MEKSRNNKKTPHLSYSAEEFLSYAVSHCTTTTKHAKSTLKALISAIPASSPLASSLPPALLASVAQSLDSFKNSLLRPQQGGDISASPRFPPSKRPRRSSRCRRHNASPSPDQKARSDTAVQLKRLQVYAHIAQFCISHPKKCFSAEAILPPVQLLHDGLVLYETDESLLSVVAALCEEWWKEKLPRRENLISQSLPYLLSKSLKQGKKADVRRVFALREAFTLFDFVDESIEDLRLLLVRCVITPLYLKTDEGRRFVAFVLALNEQLLREALALMRVQVPFGKKSVLEAYAEIVFRAWKSMKGGLRGEIEDGFLQGLVDGAIHASSKLLATSIRRVLGGFFDHRATEGVDKLLFRLAEPVLFRSLQVANSNVRLNALHLLIDVFPLEEPDVTREAKESLLGMQFFLLDKLLLDDCPDIRVVSVEGICRILNLFWEVIPPPTITRMLSKIVGDLSCDTCFEVKISVVNGMIYLLGNPQAHEVLKRLLPRLGFMFLDHVLSVRVAITDLLLAVRDIRTFQYNKIVGLDNLLSSLANDHRVVAQKITRLLIPTYFPSQKMISEACSRCVALIRRSPAAGARFCEFALLEGSSPKSLMELVSTFISLLLSAKDLSPDQVDGLFTSCASLCHTLYSETFSKRALVELISEDKFKCLLSIATSMRSQTSVLRIASIISPVNLAGFREYCVNLLINCWGLSENQDMQAEIRTAHKLIFSCGWSANLLEVLTNILKMAASKFYVEFDIQLPKCSLPSLKKVKIKLAKKGSLKLNHANGDESIISDLSSFEENYALASAAAWQLKDLMMSEDTRNAILDSISTSTFSALRISSQVCIEQHQKVSDVSPILAYTSFALNILLRIVENDLRDYNDSHHRRLPFEKTILGHTLDHLIECITKIYFDKHSAIHDNSQFKWEERSERRRSKRKFSKEELSDTKSGKDHLDDSSKEKEISHLVKIVTAVLKFVVDAVTIDLASLDGQNCLQFAAAYACHIISVLREHQYQKFLLNEEEFMCLKSSFTYSSKLLHLLLSCVESSPAPPEASYLANCLLDLITSIELNLGEKYALRLFSVAKGWLPVLILGLCSAHLNYNTVKQGSCSAAHNDLPLWLTTLSKVELNEAIELDVNMQNDSTIQSRTTVLKMVTEKVILLLKKGSLEIMGAVVVAFLLHLKFCLERGNLDIVLGLLHFICVKLLSNELLTLKELDMLNNSLHEFYLLLESAISDKTVGIDGRQKLESAKNIIKLVSDA